MEEKILFANAEDKSASVYYEGTILELGNYPDEGVLYNHIKKSDYTHIGVFSDKEEALIAMANSLAIPVIEVKDFLAQIYATDILPFDLKNLQTSLAYMGINDYNHSKAYLTCEIYQFIKKDLLWEQEFYSRRPYERRIYQNYSSRA